MKNIRTFLSLALAIFAIVWGSTQVASQSTTSKPEVVLIPEVEWSPLNPARGDQSPQAGTLWGDRNTKYQRNRGQNFRTRQLFWLGDKIVTSGFVPSRGGVHHLRAYRGQVRGASNVA